VPEHAAVLVLTHQPDVFPRVDARAALTLAGHTHGGQVNLPLVRGRVIPSRFGTRYARGHVVEGGRHLYVTSGVGTSRLPVRLLAPPEIVLLTLRAAGCR
jgi:predicted MPP superfamily phosphohydrolase